MAQPITKLLELALAKQKRQGAPARRLVVAVVLDVVGDRLSNLGVQPRSRDFEPHGRVGNGGRPSGALAGRAPPTRVKPSVERGLLVHDARANADEFRPTPRHRHLASVCVAMPPR